MIMKGQKVHASLCFVQGDYTPKATFHPDFGDLKWENIIGVGRLDDIGWAKGLENDLEFDLFDIPSIPSVIRGYIEGQNSQVWAERLEFMATIRKFKLMVPILMN